jgi:hypothetical protein
MKAILPLNGIELTLPKNSTRQPNCLRKKEREARTVNQGPVKENKKHQKI